MTATLGEILRPVAADLWRVEETMRACIDPAEERLGEFARCSLGGGAKRIRPALALLSGAAAGGPDGDARIPFAAAAELIHLATLAHDDVIDGATVRRDSPTLNAACGNSAAVIYGDYLLARAFELLSSVLGGGILPAMVDVTREVCEGELCQLGRRYDISMTAEEYREIASMKTASLFAACCRFGAELAGASAPSARRLERFGRGFGLAFQIVDDCADIAGTDTAKDRFKDLEGGRVTLPLIRALEALEDEHRERLAFAFREGNVVSCRREILLSGAVEQSGAEAAEALHAASAELSTLPHSPARAALLGLAEFFVTRTRNIHAAG